MFKNISISFILSLSFPAMAVEDASWLGNIDSYECRIVRLEKGKELHCWGGNVPVSWMERLTCPVSKIIFDTIEGRESAPCAYWFRNEKGSKERELKEMRAKE